MIISSRKTSKLRPLSEKSYPWLGENIHGLVVLFNDKYTGTVIHTPNETWIVGEYSDGWDEDAFEPFYGTISITGAN